MPYYLSLMVIWRIDTNMVKMQKKTGVIMSILAGLGVGLGALDTAVNFGLGMKNYDLQKQNYNYLKSAQQTTWNREDNAVQRRMADLKAAGLSPTLAAGSSASSSSPIQIQAPQIDAKIDTSGKLAGQMALMQAKANIARTEAELSLIEAQKNKTFEDTIGSHLGNIRSEMENNARGSDINYLQDKNLSPNSTGWTRDAVNLINAFEKTAGVNLIEIIKKIPGALSKIEVEPLKLPNPGNVLGSAISETAGKVKENIGQTYESTMQKARSAISSMNTGTRSLMEKNPLFNQLLKALDATNKWQKGGK